MLYYTLGYLYSANYINHWDKFAAEGSFDSMDIITIDEIEKMPSPRVLKCHLPFDLLPPNLLDTAKVNTTFQFHVCIFHSYI